MTNTSNQTVGIEKIPVTPTKEGEEKGVTVNRINVDMFYSKGSMFYLKGRGYFLSVYPVEVSKDGYELMAITAGIKRLISPAKRFSRKELERLAEGVVGGPQYNMAIKEVMDREKVERVPSVENSVKEVA